MARDLGQSVIAVLGGNGGLGTQISTVLEQRGATVVSVSRTSDPPIDIRDVDAGDRLVALATERHGRLDGVINATGIVAFGNLVDTDDVVIEELFLTNVLGPLWLVKRVVPALSDTKGFVVNFSGVVAEAPTAGMTAYSASKAALAASGVALHRELRRTGVQVIDVRPPHTETGLATRPLAGTAPKMPTGLDPRAVAERIVAAIEAGDHDVSSAEFG
jgi:short-subunit dehydrogenase